jgi:O-antigen ligase
MASIAVIKRHLIPATIALMWSGLFFSRALLSISMALFLITSLSSEPLSLKWKSFIRTPFRWSMSLLFFIPLLSGLWSEDRQQWLAIILDKLPLLTIPFCSTAFEKISDRDNRRLVIFSMTVALFSMARTIRHFILDPAEISESYLRAKVLQVDMYNDHVRYGWVLGLTFAWLLHLLLADIVKVRSREGKWMVAYLLFTALFLHLLASKTGLICLWISVALALIFNFKRPVARWLTGISLALPLVSWVLMPTLRNRIRFVWWDFQHYSRGGYTEGLSDTPRILSFKAGSELASRDPLLGCGFGDLRKVMDQWYASHAPFLKTYEQLLPSNEFLLHATATGIPGALVFSIAVFYPLFIRSHRKYFGWVAMHVLALAGFLYEIGLETQYGIFIYTMIGCFAFHHIQKKTADGKR